MNRVSTIFTSSKKIHHILEILEDISKFASDNISFLGTTKVAKVPLFPKGIEMSQYLGLYI